MKNLENQTVATIEAATRKKSRKSSKGYRLPPFGKSLAIRLQFSNRPFAVAVCLGQSAWDDAKRWRKRSDISPLVLPDGEQPERFTWPVNGCVCLIEWSDGPDARYVFQLVKTLLRAGASSVTVRPLFVDSSAPLYELISGEWKQTRECLHTYWANKQGGGND